MVQIFRVWSETDKKYLDSTSYRVDSEGNVYEYGRLRTDCVLERNSLVHDKNDKIIFENDIVRLIDVNGMGWYRDRVGVVNYKYGDYYPGFYVETNYGDAKDFIEDMEVLGNIHENKDLLNVVQEA